MSKVQPKAVLGENGELAKLGGVWGRLWGAWQAGMHTGKDAL